MSMEGDYAWEKLHVAVLILAGRPTVTLVDSVRLERLRQWLHGQKVSVRLPEDQVQWLDGMWREAFGGG